MAKIPLSNKTFTLVPEGTHIFQITKVEYKEDFGKMEITMTTREGMTHIERFTFVKNNGETNEVAVDIFSCLAKTALQNYDLEEIDHSDLVGHFIKAEVTHEEKENKNDPTKTITFSRLGKKYMADGFDDDDSIPDSPAPATVSTPAAPGKTKSTTTPAPRTAAPAKRTVDLASILGKK